MRFTDDRRTNQSPAAEPSVLERVAQLTDAAWHALLELADLLDTGNDRAAAELLARETLEMLDHLGGLRHRAACWHENLRVGVRYVAAPDAA
jgi:hypothetical protein